MSIRAVVFSDTHANSIALTRVYTLLQSETPMPAYCWFLGDAVGYGASPESTLDLLEKILGKPGENPNHIWLAGNHDWLLIGRGAGIHYQINGLSQNSIYEQVSDYALKAIEKHQVILEGSEFIHCLPSMSVSCDAPLAGIYLAHGFYTTHAYLEDSLKAVWEYVKEPSNVENYVYKEQWQTWKKTGLPILLTCSGHTHVPVFWRRPLSEPEQPKPGQFATGRYWEKLAFPLEWTDLEEGYIYHLNPGSVGFSSAPDGCPSFAMIEWDGYPRRIKGMKVKCADYDVSQVRAQLQAGGYPKPIWSDRLKNCIEMGE